MQDLLILPREQVEEPSEARFHGRRCAISTFLDVLVTLALTVCWDVLSTQPLRAQPF